MIDAIANDLSLWFT